MRRIIALILLCMLSPAAAEQFTSWPPASGGGSTAPSGPAGGDLGGTYPNPTVTGVGGSPFGTGVITALQAAAGGTGGFALFSATPVGANPTATAGPTAVNGSATTFMRSDAAPAIQKATNALFGIVEVDNTTITASGGVISAAAGVGPFCPLAGCTYSGAILVPAGSATTAGIGVGVANTGLYSVSTTGFGITVNGVSKLDFGVTSANIWTTPAEIIGLAFISNNSSGESFAARNNATILSSPANAVWQLGNTDAASPVAQSLFVQSVIAGTSNIAGVNWTLRGSLSTGSGASGDVIFQTGGTGAGATVQNSAVTALTIKGATQTVLIASGKALQLGNAYTAGAVTTTGYITLQDSTGTVYKLNACTGC